MMQNIERKLILSLIILLASLLMASIVYAQGNGPVTPTDNDVNRVAKQLYCPVCPNTPLDVCETKACQDWRAQIRDALSQGWTDPQIIDYFVAQYGERVLAEPQRKGFTSLVWLLPVIFVLLGLGIAYEILKGWRAGRPAVPAPVALVQIPDDIREKIERELREKA
jgi:cytochrome c-type biogenesis protein CcmH